jgi:hypothetical protein
MTKAVLDITIMIVLVPHTMGHSLGSGTPIASFFGRHEHGAHHIPE